MRILYVVQHFAGPSGSGSSRVFENARRLAAAGHAVTLLCGRTDKSTDADEADARSAGIAIRRAPILYAQRMSYAKRLLVFRAYLRWAVREGKAAARPDVVFASSTPLTVGEIGRRVAAHHGAPFVFEVRDLWPEVPEALGALRNPVLRWMARRMARRVYRAADRVVALSPDMARVVAAWGVPEDRVAVVPNASDLDLFGTVETEAARTARREKLGWSGLFVGIHPGAMGLVNGLDYLLDAGAWLDAKGEKGLRIVLLGDGAQRARLQARLVAERIDSVVVHPPIPKREVPFWVAAADVGIVTVAAKPFLEMNSANKFFDALAARRPVLLNYGGWQAEALRASGAGLDADPTDPTAFAKLMLALRDEPERCRAMGAAARRLAEERYGRDDLARELESVLSAVAREGATRSAGR